MAKESEFVSQAQDLVKTGLGNQQTLEVRRGAPLLYQVTVDNKLNVMSSDKVRNPKRGDSAFQTDLCVFEITPSDVWLPRVVLEFKTSVSTHDVLTYSTKAAKHKQIYPYLRYGMIAEKESQVPGRFFTHNEGMDFFLSLDGLSLSEKNDALMGLVRQELAASKALEDVAFGSRCTRLYRTEIVLSDISSAPC